jgi:hypothetical protein
MIYDGAAPLSRSNVQNKSGSALGYGCGAGPLLSNVVATTMAR